MVDFSKLLVLDLSSKADSDMRGFYILAVNQFAGFAGFEVSLTIYSESVIMKWRSNDREWENLV